MVPRLMRGFHALPFKEKRTRIQQPVNLQPKMPGWRYKAVIIVGLALVAGCAGSSQQMLTAQALSQRKAPYLNTAQVPSQRMAPDPNKDVQQQLIMNASHAVLANYKDYQVGPEDELSVTIFGQDKLNRELRVNGQGEIAMPMVGTIKVGGMTPQQIEKRLEDLYNDSYLVNPQITVKVKEYRHQRVAVTGAVAKPGTYELIGPRPLLEVLSLAGGFVNQGNPTGGGAQAGDVVNVIRHKNAPDLATKMNAVAASQPFSPNTETMVIDLQSLVRGQDPRLNIPIRSGDVVNVPFAGIAYVLGGVRKPGNIPVTGKVTVSQAVAMAGGLDPILGTNSITIMRFDDQGKPIKIDTNLKQIIARNSDDLPLKDNDVVVVQESKAKKTMFVIRTLLPIPTGSYGVGF
jgi:polysaccharide export outer membrane protein